MCAWVEGEYGVSSTCIDTNSKSNTGPNLKCGENTASCTVDIRNLRGSHVSIHNYQCRVYKSVDITDTHKHTRYCIDLAHPIMVPSVSKLSGTCAPLSNKACTEFMHNTHTHKTMHTNQFKPTPPTRTVTYMYCTCIYMHMYTNKLLAVFFENKPLDDVQLLVRM